MFKQLTLALLFFIIAAFASPAPSPEPVPELVELVPRAHKITFHNKCNRKVTPTLHNTGGIFRTLKQLSKGEKVHTSVPEGVSISNVWYEIYS